MRPQRTLISLTGGLCLGALACLAQAASPPPAPSLSACAALPVDAERLACYDRLSGHAAPAAVSPAAQPAAASATSSPPAPSSPPAAAAVQPAPAPAVSGGAAAAPAPGSFGLYAAEHPKPPPVSTSLDARVVAVGHNATGRMTVSLEDGALWELEEADPLLAEGDTVSITRASFGSYLMRTPSKRLLRARRVH